MKRTKPDLITVLVIIFGLGLVLSGFTNSQPNEQGVSSKAIEATVYSTVH